MNRALSDSLYQHFRELLLAHTGLDFPPARRTDLATWLWRAVDMIQDALRYRLAEDSEPAPPESLEALYERLLDGNALAWEKVIDAVTVGETHFFRNMAQFDALRDHVLTPLIAQRRASGDRRLAIWSAGCATGEEPYSLAMLLNEMLPDFADWQITLLGTDINRGMIERARQGVYRDWSFREDYALYARRVYFDQIDSRYHLREAIRGTVAFEAGSLLEHCRTFEADSRQFDVIFCRNVLLYFGEQVRRWTYQQLFKLLRPGGWLFVGHADPPPPEFAAFQVYNLRNTTAYRRPEPSRPERAVESRPGIDTPAHTDPLPDIVVTREISPPMLDERRSTQDDAETQFRMGRWHADRHHWQEALYHCERAIALRPTYTEVYYTLALIYQHLGQLDQAIEALRRAIYLRRNWALPRFTLAGLFLRTDQIAHARREFRNVVALTNDLAPNTPIEGAEGLTAARLKEAAERQLARLVSPRDQS
ncbi:MAG: protein-glutamate O-methyltransferase CheR [Anaerolineae bacterium]